MARPDTSVPSSMSAYCLRRDGIEGLTSQLVPMMTLGAFHEGFLWGVSLVGPMLASALTAFDPVPRHALIHLTALFSWQRL